MARLCDPRTVDRRSWILLGLLAALWGASYLFIKIGLEDFSPAMVVFLRTLLAALVLAPLALHRGAMRGPAAALLADRRARRRPGGRPVPPDQLGRGGDLLLARGDPRRVGADPDRAARGLHRSRGAANASSAASASASGSSAWRCCSGVDVGGDSAALVGGLAVVLASLGYAIGGFYLKAQLQGHAADRRRHGHDVRQRAARPAAGAALVPRRCARARARSRRWPRWARAAPAWRS